MPAPTLTVHGRSSRLLTDKASADAFNNRWNDYDAIVGGMGLVVASGLAAYAPTRIAGLLITGYSGVELMSGTASRIYAEQGYRVVTEVVSVNNGLGSERYGVYMSIYDRGGQVYRERAFMAQACTD